MTNLAHGAELPTSAELAMADHLWAAVRAVVGTCYESRLRDVLVEVLTDMLYDGLTAARVMRLLDQGSAVSVFSAVRLALSD